MFPKAALIIDKRQEQAVRYKKILESCGITVFIAADFPRALNIMSRFEPDAVLISDSLDFDMKKLIEQIRVLTFNTRPVIIALSKSSRIQDKIDVLDAGADDFISEPVNRDEFKARISAHIRRIFENSFSDKTMMFNSKISYKMLKRTINSGAKRAFMLIDINKFSSYKEIYGEFAAEKLLQTCSAVIKSAVSPGDYAGQLEDWSFIVITDNDMAERIANYIVHAFDAAVSKFYSTKDGARGCIFMSGDDTAEDKTGLAEVKIGVVTNQYSKYTDVKQILNSLAEVHKLSKYKKKSAYTIERLKITSETAPIVHDNNRILIAEPDEALSILLEASAALQGYKVKVIDDFDKIFEAAAKFNPAVIILDAGNYETLKGLEVCRKLKFETPDFKSNIILTAALHDKELILNAGADLYLPKPYELSAMFVWVRKFIDEAGNF